MLFHIVPPILSCCLLLATNARDLREGVQRPTNHTGIIDSSSKINYTTPKEDQDFVVYLNDTLSPKIKASATEALYQVPASPSVLSDIYQSISATRSLPKLSVSSASIDYLPSTSSGENEGDNEGGDDDDRNVQSSGDNSGDMSGSGEEGSGGMGSGDKNQDTKVVTTRPPKQHNTTATYNTTEIFFNTTITLHNITNYNTTLSYNTTDPYNHTLQSNTTTLYNSTIIHSNTTDTYNNTTDYNTTYLERQRLRLAEAVETFLAKLPNNPSCDVKELDNEVRNQWMNKIENEVFKTWNDLKSRMVDSGDLPRQNSFDLFIFMKMKRRRLTELKSAQEQAVTRSLLKRRYCARDNQYFEQRKVLTEFTNEIQRPLIDVSQAFAPLAKYIRFLYQHHKGDNAETSSQISKEEATMQLVNKAFNMIFTPETIDPHPRRGYPDGGLGIIFHKIHHEALELLHYVPNTSWNVKAREAILHKAFSLKVFLEFLTPDSSFIGE